MTINSRTWWPVIIILASLLLLKLLAPILMPFAVGAVLAYMGDPLADKLEARGHSRTVAVVVVFCSLSLFALILTAIALPLLLDQFQLLLTRLFSIMDWLQTTALPVLRESLDLPAESPAVETARQALSGHWGSAGSVLLYLWQQVSSSSLVLVAWIGNLTLIPVVAFYLLRDWDVLMDSIRRLLPRHMEQKTSEVAAECDEILGAFARGQLLVMAALAVVYTIGLWVVGLDMALVIGLGAGLASIVPYLGFIIGIAAAGLAAYFQFDGIGPLLGVAVVFGIGQLLESLWLTPTLVGEKIGLHPVAVIFALLAGGQLFGFLGVLIALPVAAVVKVMLGHANEFYLRSEFYGAADVAELEAEQE